MMIIVRFFLYLICIISIGWSVLVFGGPPIIKRIISAYSNGALMASGVTVSPGLSIVISRLEFNFQNQITGRDIEGFSRATEITWSIFGEKPFLEINLGPSVIKDTATADTVHLLTPSLNKMDWQNIAVVANVRGLALRSLVKMEFLTAEGNVNLKSGKVSNAIIEVENFNVTGGKPTYSANSIRGEFTEFNYNLRLSDQLFSSAFEIDNIVVLEPSLNASKATLEISVTEDIRNLNIDIKDLKLPDFEGSAATVEIGGRFDQLNDLQEVKIDFADGIFFNRLPKIPSISAKVNKSDDEQYDSKIEGTLDEFEVYNSGTFIGVLPSGNFVIDSRLEKRISKVTSLSKINLVSLGGTEFIGSFEMDFTSEPLVNLNCSLIDCELSEFELSYKMNIDNEWVEGRATCPKNFCGLLVLEHFVQTSDTLNIFTVLNQENILNPLSSLYLYKLISAGQKISDGHQLSFQF